MFNSLRWGTSREEVVKSLKEKYPSLVEKKCDEYKYGTVKQVICSYQSSSYGKLGTVGDMDVDSITVWYICEEGTFDYYMFAAEYKCESLSPYKAMAEMLEYKYGHPYSHHTENSEVYGSTFDIDKFTWTNEDMSQKVSITRQNNAMDFGILFGKSSITYDRSVEIYYG